jgi:hypothetical protein
MKPVPKITSQTIAISIMSLNLSFVIGMYPDGCAVWGERSLDGPKGWKQITRTMSPASYIVGVTRS